MAIYTGPNPDFDSKGLPGSADGRPGELYPDNAVESPWRRVEPLVSPDQVVTRFLFGIPLQTRFKDPATGKPFKLGNDQIKDLIDQAVSTVEEETRLDIMPTQLAEKYPFDRAEYQSFGYFKLRHRPIASIESLTVCPADNNDVFIVPTQWIETAYLPWGQLALIPLTLAMTNGGIVNTQGGGGAVFLNILGSKPWVPAFWRITYTAGFPNGQLPKPLNRLIGIVTAMDILSQLAAADSRVVSASLGTDGLSQSTGTEGSKRFAQRMQELGEERKKLAGRIMKRYGTRFGMGNV